MSGYYVYTFAYSDGTVFYVGKGQGDGCLSRIRSHLYEAVGKRTTVSRVATVIRSIWREGGKIVIRKPYKGLSEVEAFQLEKGLIEFYGYEQLINRPAMSMKNVIAVKKVDAMIAQDGAIIL